MATLFTHVLGLFVCFALIMMTRTEGKTIQKRATADANPNIKRLFNDIGGRQKVDLVLALDRSKSISEEVYYLKVKKLSKAILQQYATLDPDFVRLAVVTFAINSTVEFDYISNPDIAKTKCALFNGENAKWDDISYEVNLPATNIKAAFEKSIEIFKKGKQYRSDAKQVILLISDGKYNDDNDPIEVSRQLREGEGVTIYGVGIGVWLEIGNVRTLTTAIDGNNDLYADYDEWVSYVTGGAELTSYSKDGSQTWTKIYSGTCSETCGTNAGCYCDIDRGYEQCLCNVGYFFNSTSGECTECQANTYKGYPGNDEQCVSCPPGTTSPKKSTAKAQCTCENAPCTDPCEASPCGANENCIADNQTDYHCECQDGWEGPDCMTNIDECAATTSTCPAGSVCQDGVGTGVFSCICSLWGYIGRFCEINEDECVPGLCKNNATCSDAINNFMCTCEPEYAGRYCQDSADKTTTTTQGVDPIRTTTTTTMTPSVTAGPVVGEDNLFWIIVGASVGGGLLLLIIIIVVTVVMCRKKKEKNKEEVKSIAHQFSGFWKRKTVRGSKWMDEEVNGGLPSAPSGHRPDLLNDTNTINGSVENLKTDEYTELPYDTMTLKTGMESWQNYITELEESKVIERALVAKTTGDKIARTSAWLYDQTEVDHLETIMDDQEENVPMRIQDGEYHILENDGTLASGKTIGDLQEARIVCIGRTKMYVIVAIASDEKDEGKVRKEVQWIVDHISGEGY